MESVLLDDMHRRRRGCTLPLNTVLGATLSCPLIRWHECSSSWLRAWGVASSPNKSPSYAKVMLASKVLTSFLGGALRNSLDINPPFSWLVALEWEAMIPPGHSQRSQAAGREGPKGLLISVRVPFPPLTCDLGQNNPRRVRGVEGVRPGAGVPRTR